MIQQKMIPRDAIPEDYGELAQLTLRERLEANYKRYHAGLAYRRKLQAEAEAGKAQAAQAEQIIQARSRSRCQ